ncbi:cyclic nucleotide-binding domain protein (macronuclear) [Tetrahymena thermophila SB210]|uniref:Cyclic nucleotide-binding domain protein n=1 Tax=Tetrahymena thermophila (strain SB210) TaxID=312017 RepID=I7M232_TETTS|nr:cyclic nucleotide-binding domain protein [Tetrahymena thermophila SB210]EAR98388.2 cyclic nucleotide-binding domain protein [Tetrahymena thermophila SB210]|eukprot:XP_001018633.2 cyclic nucleotide-binding domain protein [Tetrahymena thermophila SB210]
MSTMNDQQLNVKSGNSRSNYQIASLSSSNTQKDLQQQYPLAEKTIQNPLILNPLIKLNNQPIQYDISEKTFRDINNEEPNQQKRFSGFDQGIDDTDLIFKEGKDLFQKSQQSLNFASNFSSLTFKSQYEVLSSSQNIIQKDDTNIENLHNIQSGQIKSKGSDKLSETISQKSQINNQSLLQENIISQNYIKENTNQQQDDINHDTFYKNELNENEDNLEKRKKNVVLDIVNRNVNQKIKQNENLTIKLNNSEKQTIPGNEDISKFEDQQIRERNQTQIPSPDKFQKRINNDDLQALGDQISPNQNRRQHKFDKVNKINQKSKFKANNTIEKALRILIYKKREQRNNEDLATLQKATIDMNFFKELLSKKSNIQNNIHQNLCKAMQYEYRKQGSVVFYAGDIPDRFYILLKGEVAVLLKKQQEEIDKLKKGQNLDPTDEKKKSKFTLRKYLLFKKFQKVVNNLKIVILFINRLKALKNGTEETEEDYYSQNIFNFNETQAVLQNKDELNQNKVITSQNKIALFANEIETQSSKITNSSNPPAFNNFSELKKKQSIFLQPINNRASLFSPENNTKLQSIIMDTSGQSCLSPNISIEKQNKKKKKKKKDLQFTIKQQPTKPIDDKKKNLLPSQLAIYESKLQDQLKQDIMTSSKNITGLFKMPKMSILQTSQPKKKDNTQQLQQQSTLNQSQSMTQSQQKNQNNSTELNSAEEKEQQINTNNQSKQIQTPEGGKQEIRSVRKSYLKKKILVDFQKVRLGVRLAKIFEPSSQQSQLNIGGVKILQCFQMQNENLKKMLPKLDLMSLENSAHFFDENIFKYFHASNLGEGRVFGDLGILTKKPRAATIVCNEDCYFGVLNVEDYSKILMEQKKKKMQKGIKFLASTINISLSIEKMAKISQFFEKRQFASGERIYEEGDQVQHIYIIKRGEVELFRKLQTSYGINQNQTITVSIGIIGIKSYFGEDDTIFNRKRKYTAVAKIDTKLLMCKKKDFQKLMNEISEMNIALKEMAIQKEFWRDQKYSDIQKTRNSIKKIETLYKARNASNSISQQLSENENRLQQQINDALSTLVSQQTHKTQYTQEDDQYENQQSEEIVRRQLLKLEKDSKILNLAVSRNRENSLSLNRSSIKPNPQQQSVFIEKSQILQLNNESYQMNSPKSQVTNQKSPQSSPRQSPRKSPILSPQKPQFYSPRIHPIQIPKNKPNQSLKQSPNNRNSQLQSPQNRDSIQNFSSCFQDYVQQETKEIQSQVEPATSTITKDNFIGSGINSQKCYFKGNYRNISPRLKEIIQQNPDLNKEGQIKELLCKIQYKKQILQNNSLGQQQLSVMHIFKETSDIFNDATHKQHKMRDFRKHLESADGSKRYSLNEKQFIKQGKMTRQEKIEQLLQKFKEKTLIQNDLTKSLTGEFFIQSQSPQIKDKIPSCKRTNSLDYLLNSEMFQKKDFVIQSDSLNNSENVMQSSINSQSSAQSQMKKHDCDNFIFFGQQSANKGLNARKLRSSFFYNPKHHRIGSLNLQSTKQSKFLVQNQHSILNSSNKSSLIDQDHLKNEQQSKTNHRQSFSQTQNSCFFKNISEFTNPLPSPNESPFKSNKSFGKLKSIQSNMEKIVIVNHMGKPTTFLQQTFQQQLK